MSRSIEAATTASHASRAAPRSPRATTCMAARLYLEPPPIIRTYRSGWGRRVSSRYTCWDTPAATSRGLGPAAVHLPVRPRPSADSCSLVVPQLGSGSPTPVRLSTHRSRTCTRSHAHDIIISPGNGTVSWDLQQNSRAPPAATRLAGHRKPTRVAAASASHSRRPCPAANDSCFSPAHVVRH